MEKIKKLRFEIRNFLRSRCKDKSQWKKKSFENHPESVIVRYPESIMQDLQEHRFVETRVVVSKLGGGVDIYR